MGEKKENAKPARAGGDDKVTAVYKIDMHCEGCAKKIKRTIKHSDGVEEVRADCGANKLTVIGKMDPAKIKERLEEKTNKKVELVSPQPKKDAGAGDKKAEKKKPEKKPEETKVKTKQRLEEEKNKVKPTNDGRRVDKKADEKKSGKKAEEKKDKKKEEKKAVHKEKSVVSKDLVRHLKEGACQKKTKGGGGGGGGGGVWIAKMDVKIEGNINVFIVT